jgi:predicted transcriptional regulator
MTATATAGTTTGRIVTTAECKARRAEIVYELAVMGMTIKQAHEHANEYRLTEAQFELIAEYDGLTWLIAE